MGGVLHPNSPITRERIAATEQVIRAHVRHTLVIDVEAADFGLAEAKLQLKLELLQRSGSFKARGAFANLLMRDVPKAGVVAASGGNHGAAVAYAAKTLGVPATIFVPSISSPAKIARIRDLGAEFVGGERYADALAESERRVTETGAMAIHGLSSRRPCLGRAQWGARWLPGREIIAAPPSTC